jgi:16S rRNA (uracil1498-N3)-methyltransferase
LDENPGGKSFMSALPAQRKPEDRVTVLIGPEGGWTDAEREHFKAWTAITLGPLILRAETAAIAALAILRNAWLL